MCFLLPVHIASNSWTSLSASLISWNAAATGDRSAHLLLRALCSKSFNECALNWWLTCWYSLLRDSRYFCTASCFHKAWESWWFFLCQLLKDRVTLAVSNKGFGLQNPWLCSPTMKPVFFAIGGRRQLSSWLWQQQLASRLLKRQTFRKGFILFLIFPPPEIKSTQYIGQCCYLEKESILLKKTHNKQTQGWHQAHILVWLHWHKCNCHGQNYVCFSPSLNQKLFVLTEGWKKSFLSPPQTVYLWKSSCRWLFTDNSFILPYVSSEKSNHFMPYWWKKNVAEKKNQC